MTMTDPIADMLTRLRNANSAYHDTVSMPHSKLKANIAKILESEGCISGSAVADAEVGKTLTLTGAEVDGGYLPRCVASVHAALVGRERAPAPAAPASHPGSDARP